MGVCRPVLQILTLFQTKKCDFSHPFSDLASKKLFHHFIDWNANKIDFLKIHFEFAYFALVLLIRNWNDKYFYSLSLLPSKTIYPIPGQNGQSLYPFSNQNSAKTIPFGTAHTYVAYVRKCPTGHWIPPSSGWDVVSSKEITTTILTPTSSTTTTMSFICMTWPYKYLQYCNSWSILFVVFPQVPEAHEICVEGLTAGLKLTGIAP